MNHLDENLRHLLNVAKNADNPSDYELKRNKLRILRRVGAKVVIPTLISTATASTAAAKTTALTTGTTAAVAVNTSIAVGTTSTQSLWGWLSIGIFMGFGAATTASLPGDENTTQHSVNEQALTIARHVPSRMRAPSNASITTLTNSTTTLPQTGSQASSGDVPRPLNRTPVATKTSPLSTSRSPVNTTQLRINLPSMKNVAEHPVAETVFDTPRIAPTHDVSPKAHDDLSEVLTVLSQTQRRLAEGRANEAVSQLDLFANSHPNGAMGEERSALRIIALCRAGERSSQHMARLFLEEKPSSPMAPRVRQACGF
jgi:hypothetical protein